MLKFEENKGDFAKIWQKLGGIAPGSAAHEADPKNCFSSGGKGLFKRRGTAENTW